MHEAVSPQALGMVADLLKLLLTTGTTLLTLSITFMDKILGRTSYRHRGLWLAWALLLISIPAILFCLSQTITVTTTMGDAVVLDPDVDPARLADGATKKALATAERVRRDRLDKETIASWYALSVYSGITVGVWTLGVILLVMFVLLEFRKKPDQLQQDSDGAQDSRSG